MKTIQLSGKKSSQFHTIVDDIDYEFLMQWTWHRNSWGYVMRTCYGHDVEGVIVYHYSLCMHKVIAEHSGLLVGGLKVDHRNLNKLDNQRNNLRIATHADNIRNNPRRVDNTSGFKGVSRQGNRWKVGIQVDSKRIHLGYFSHIEDAADAYAKAAIKYFGEFANLG